MIYLHLQAMRPEEEIVFFFVYSNTVRTIVFTSLFSRIIGDCVTNAELFRVNVFLPIETGIFTMAAQAI